MATNRKPQSQEQDPQPSNERKAAEAAVALLTLREQKSARALLRAEHATLKRMKSTVKRASNSLVASVVPVDRAAASTFANARIRHEQAVLQTQLQRDLVDGTAGAREAARPGVKAVVEAPVAPDAEAHIEDDTAAFAASSSLASQWANAAFTVVTMWPSGNPEAPTLAKELSAVNDMVDNRVRRTAATETARAFNDERSSLLDRLAQQTPANDVEAAAELGVTTPVAGETLYKVWSAFLDMRTCPTCSKNHGNMVRTGQVFPEGDPPVHPLCRCFVDYMIVPAGYQVADEAAFRREVRAIMTARRLELEASRASADAEKAAAAKKARAERDAEVRREAAAKKAAADREAERIAAEQRAARAELERIQAERAAAEAEARRLAELEAKRLAEAEARRIAEEAAAKKAAEESAAARRAAEEAEARRVAAEEAAARRAAEESALRKAQEEAAAAREAARKAEEALKAEQAARKAAEAESRRLAEEARIKAEAERQAKEAAAARAEAERKAAAEAEARRKTEEAARKAEAEKAAREQAAREKAARDAEAARAEAERKAKEEAEALARQKAEASQKASDPISVRKDLDRSTANELGAAMGLKGEKDPAKIEHALSEISQKIFGKGNVPDAAGWRKIWQMPDGYELKFNMFDSDGQRLIVSAEIKKDGQWVGSLDRTFSRNGADIVVKHDYFEVEAEHQGKGFAQSMMKSSVKAYQDLGIDRIEMEAGLDVGKYAWARYGFTWNAKEAEQKYGALKQFLGTQFPKKAAAEIEALAQAAHVGAPAVSSIELGGRKIGKEFLLQGESWKGALKLKHGDVGFEIAKKRLGLEGMKAAEAPAAKPVTKAAPPKAAEPKAKPKPAAEPKPAQKAPPKPGKAPEPTAAPAPRAEPVQPKESVEVGRQHIRSIENKTEFTQDQVRKVLDAMVPDAGTAAFLETYPLQLLEFTKSILGNGSYRSKTAYEIRLRPDPRRQEFGKRWKPGKGHTVSISGKTAEETVQMNAIHELGHHIMDAAEHTPEGQAIQSFVKNAFESGKANHISLYAKQDPSEYFAESYNAYRTYPADFLKHDPNGYHMVEEILRRRKIIQ